MRMNSGRFDRWMGASFFSPKDFVRHAVLIVLVFAIAHAFGLREYTAIICGTMASPALGPETCALLGIGYMLLYFGVVVLVPILLIAAALLKIASILSDNQHHEP